MTLKGDLAESWQGILDPAAGGELPDHGLVELRVNDSVVDELTVKLRQSSDRADQRAIARKITDREVDQVLRMWMPWGTIFVLSQPHLRNVGGGVLRGNVGYGSPTVARMWIDK